MTPVQLVGTAPRDLRLEGDLTAAGVGTLMETLPADGSAHCVSLAGIGRVDSAGLALLIEWQRRLEDAQGTLEFEVVPESLVRLARISSVATLLGFEAEEAGDAEQ